MRLVKAVLAGVLILALGAMWTNRGLVFDAYRSDDPVASVRLSGVDLAFEPTPIEATPYRLPSAPDTRTAAEAAFGPGRSVPPPPPLLTGGDAELRGTITGPDGPVAGAIVRVERHTDHGAISVDTPTDEEGQWSLDGVAGGRYRVRAWLPDGLTMGRSEVRFVADDDVATFDFALWGIDPAPFFEFVDGGPMYEGLPATVAVVLGWQSIDAEGLVVNNPLPGAQVTIQTTAQVEVLSSQPQLTGNDGVVLVQLRCVPTSVAPLDPPPAADAVDPTVEVALASGRRIGAQAPTQTAGPGGSLTASSGDTWATFALPGCLPAPEPVPDPATEPAPGAAQTPGQEPGVEPEPSEDGGRPDA